MEPQIIYRTHSSWWFTELTICPQYTGPVGFVTNGAPDYLQDTLLLVVQGAYNLSSVHMTSLLCDQWSPQIIYRTHSSWWFTELTICPQYTRPVCFVTNGVPRLSTGHTPPGGSRSLQYVLSIHGQFALWPMEPQIIYRTHSSWWFTELTICPQYKGPVCFMTNGAPDYLQDTLLLVVHGAYNLSSAHTVITHDYLCCVLIVGAELLHRKAPCSMWMTADCTVAEITAIKLACVNQKTSLWRLTIC